MARADVKLFEPLGRALRRWLEEHRGQMAWDEARGEYDAASGNLT
jgi:hypothetical protein